MAVRRKPSAAVRQVAPAPARSLSFTGPDAAEGVRDVVIAGNDQAVLEAILDEALADGLPRPWSLDAPLVDAGLDSVAVLTVLHEIEARLGVSLSDRDLTAENFATLRGLIALVEQRRGGRT